MMEKQLLHYQWGIYVTAHARKQLQDMLDVVGMDAVYCDTDSIKFLHPDVHIPEFEAKNKILEKRAIDHDIPAFCDVGDNRYILGVWELDDLYIQFKTLGAKKYCGVEWDEKAAQSGKDPVRFTSTVAGMNKNQARKISSAVIISGYAAGWKMLAVRSVVSIIRNHITSK